MESILFERMGLLKTCTRHCRGLYVGQVRERKSEKFGCGEREWLGCVCRVLLSPNSSSYVPV